MADGPSNGLVKPKEVEETWTRTQRSGNCFEPHPIVTEAWEALRRSLVHFHGQPVGTVAALDKSSEELNYDQVPNELKQKYFVDETWGMFGNLDSPPALISDSESCMASRRKRKIDSDPMPSVTRIVTAEITFNDDVDIFKFRISSGVLNLKNVVAQRFKLDSNRLRLKYIDKENDLILIACDEDLKLAVDTIAISNRINLICLPVGVCAGRVHDVEVIQPTLEFVADNFTCQMDSSDSESLVPTGSTDAGEKSHKKRKKVLDTISPVTGMVTAKITFNEYMKIFQFLISSGLSNLKNEVARSFKLKGKMLRLKYWDEDDDLILVACDVDLKLAVVTTGSNNTINLICLSD